MPDGTRGPSYADIREMKRSMHLKSLPERARRMDDALTRLLRLTHALGAAKQGTPDYKRLRHMVAEAKKEYLRKCQEWGEGLAESQLITYRRDTAHKLSEMMVEITGRYGDDTLGRISREVRKAIHWAQYGYDV